MGKKRLRSFNKIDIRIGKCEKQRKKNFIIDKRAAEAEQNRIYYYKKMEITKTFLVFLFVKEKKYGNS